MSLSSLLKSVSNFLTTLPVLKNVHRDIENAKQIDNKDTNAHTDQTEKIPESTSQEDIDGQSEQHTDSEHDLKTDEVVNHANTDNSNDPSDVKKESALSENSTDAKDTPQNTAIDVNNEVLMEKPVETTPDVYLDVPSLKVQELKLNVEDLNARVALNAELAGLIKINVGVNAGIKKLDLDLKGVDLKAVLKVRLKQVYAIFDRALTTIDNNPDILKTQQLPPSDNVHQLQNEVAGDINQTGKKGDTPIETHHSLNKDEQRYRFREDAD